MSLAAVLHPRPPTSSPSFLHLPLKPRGPTLEKGVLLPYLDRFEMEGLGVGLILGPAFLPGWCSDGLLLKKLAL